MLTYFKIEVYVDFSFFLLITLMGVQSSGMFLSLLAPLVSCAPQTCSELPKYWVNPVELGPCKNVVASDVHVVPSFPNL